MEEERIESFDDTNWNISDGEGDIDSSDSEFEDTDDTVETDVNVPSLKKIINCAKTRIKKLCEVSSSVCDDERQKLREYYSEDSHHEYEHKDGKNLMIVIQNKDFVKSLQRHGSTADVENLKKTFKPLGFIVKSFKNLCGEKIDVKLRKARQKFNHKDASCFACVILSHGNQYETDDNQMKDSVLGTDEQAISVEYIMKIFNDVNCPDLMGKPRLFFIQACRGKGYDKGTDFLVPVKAITSSEPHNHIEQITKELKETFIDGTPETSFTTFTYPTPCYPDSMVMFASPPGYAAYARKGGSIFISCLCDEFENYNKRHNFFQILSRVANQMASDFETSKIEDSRYEKCKVVPCLHSCLTRDVKFQISDD